MKVKKTNTLLNMLLMFVDESWHESICNDAITGHNWEYAPGIRMNFGIFDVKFLWQFLSMYIYIP
jgi:hypothetical protein